MNWKKRMGSEEERSVEEEVSFPIVLADRIRKSVEEAESFKVECMEAGKQVERVSQMLRSIVRLATCSSSSSPPLYQRPVRRILSQVTKTLDRALILVRKCKPSGVLRRVVTITSATDFRKLFTLLDASIGDIKWLLSVFDSVSGAAGGGILLSLPPIASNDPILSWVWSYIATVQMGGNLPDRIEAANELASLAFDNDRNKKIIVEEGGISPLLKLLKEGVSPDAQMAASLALSNLATDQERVRQIVQDQGVPIIVQVLWDSPIRVQIALANLLSRMAENDPAAQQEFARENAIRPLVSLLSLDMLVFDDHPRTTQPRKPTTLHSFVKYNRETNSNSSYSMNHASNNQQHYPHSNSSSSLHYEGTSKGGGHYKKDRENENPQVKLMLKIKCAEALWFLSKESVENSQRITETKGLLCLAKYIEHENRDLQYNCLMTVMEITGAAESNADLRRSAFKTSSSAAKSVIEQLLRVIQEEESLSLQIPAIKSIGSLARTFHAKETQVIGPLVAKLDHKNTDVATEAIVALEKFACPENFLCVQHSKAIIEFEAVLPLMRLLRASDNAQLHGLILLCYLALNASNSDALQRGRVLSALEGSLRSAVSQHPLLKELIPRAIYNLELYQAAAHPHRHPYAT